MERNQDTLRAVLDIKERVIKNLDFYFIQGEGYSEYFDYIKRAEMLYIRY